MNIAIEGCLHGELDKVYATLLYVQQLKQIKIDLLICCGDFQSLRNKEDMYNMSCPEKYMSIGNFYEYYTGKKKAPILTIFIGGNHEASNYLRELQFGGWVAENIYYLGSSNIISVQKGNQKLRIGGISGIYKDYHFKKGYFEKSPLNEKAKKSVYHMREFDVFKLNFISGDVNMFIGHDWPLGIHQHGNVNELLRIKPYFRQEIENNTLGNPALTCILHKLRPQYWFAAHLHVKFAAEVQPEESKTTKFVALDKCLPQRDFLQIINTSNVNTNSNSEEMVVEDQHSSEPVELFYDLEWLAIQKFLIPRTPVADYETNFMNTAGNERDWNVENSEGIITEIKKCKDLLKTENLKIPLNFQQTAPAYDPKQSQSFSFRDKQKISNQTEDYLKMLGLDSKMFNNFLFYDHEKRKEEIKAQIIKDINEDEIDLGLDEEIIPSKNEASQQIVQEKIIHENDIKLESFNVNISVEDLPFI